jgi:hypothetical protein
MLKACMRSPSGLVREVARIGVDLREATASEHAAALAVVNAEKLAERAVKDFVAAYDAGKYVEANALAVKHLETSQELRRAQKQLAACRSRREWHEGEMLAFERL